GGLQLDSRVAMLQGGKSGPAIVPGRPEDSLLIRAVTHSDSRIKMPLGAAKLKDQEIADLSYWVRLGAPWPETKDQPKKEVAQEKKRFTITPEQRKFWSFHPIGKPEPLKVRDASWPKSPIDHFILAKLDAAGFQPVKPADKR